MRLAVRTPFAGRRLLDFLAYHLVPGVEVAAPGWYARTLDLPHGPGTVRLRLDDLPGAVAPASWRPSSGSPTCATPPRPASAHAGCSTPTATPWPSTRTSAPTPSSATSVRATPGLRVPGQVDGDETAVRTVIGQQVSVTGARTVAGRIVAGARRPGRLAGVPGLTHLFPDAATLAGVDPETLPMPRARGRALVGLASALADGEVVLDRGPDRDDVRRALLALPGIGPWTADYVAMRALGAPRRLPAHRPRRAPRCWRTWRVGGAEPDPHAWRPWRSYALMHLWNPLMPPTPAPDPHPTAAPRPAKET